MKKSACSGGSWRCIKKIFGVSPSMIIAVLVEVENRLWLRMRQRQNISTKNNTSRMNISVALNHESFLRRLELGKVI